MDNWTTLKAVLEHDKQAWEEMISLTEQQEKQIFLSDNERQALRVTLITFMGLSESVGHYLDIMGEIESGTFDGEAFKNA